jgi:hypothetical protein
MASNRPFVIDSSTHRTYDGTGESETFQIAKLQVFQNQDKTNDWRSQHDHAMMHGELFMRHSTWSMAALRAATSKN